MDALQVLENRAARFVTGKDMGTHVKDLLAECGWLSVRQLEVFHSIVQVYKTLSTGAPQHLYDRLRKSGDFPYNTRLATSGSIRMGPSFKTRLNITERSFVNRATAHYNSIPDEIRQCPTLETFKRKLKAWIQANIPV